MRDRSRSSNLSHRSSVRLKPFNTNRVEGPHFPTKYESITDELGFRPDQSTRHLKIDFTRPITGVWQNQPHWWYESRHAFEHFSPQTFLDQPMRFFPAHIKTINSYLYNQMLEDVNNIVEDLSLVNEIIELIELPAALSEMMGKGLKSLKDLAVSSGDSPAVTAQFVVGPMISSAKALAESLYGAQTRIAERLGPPRMLSRKFAGQYHIASEPGGLEKSHSFRFDVDGYSSCLLRGKVTAQAIPIPFEIEGLLQCLDTFGVHLDVLTLWDALPFSWLVDWVFPIGEYLGQFKQRGWMPIAYSFTGTYSHKYNLYVTGHSPKTAYGTWKYVEDGNYSVRGYERGPASFTGSGGLFYPPNPPNFSLTKAKILQEIFVPIKLEHFKKKKRPKRGNKQAGS